MNSEQVINAYIKRIPKSKWELINRTEKGIQVREIKQIKMLGFWIGLLLIPFWGIGLVLWIFVFLDYVLKREKIRFITIDQMIKQLQAAK